MTDDQQTTIEPPDAENLKAQITELERKRDEYLAGWQRERADFQNYKKEEARRAEGTDEDILFIHRK